MNIEDMRSELKRLSAKRLKAYDAWQSAVREWSQAHERLKREEIRAELLEEQAKEKEQS